VQAEVHYLDAAINLGNIETRRVRKVLIEQEPEP